MNVPLVLLNIDISVTCIHNLNEGATCINKP